eukprot:5061851-Pyramimonas_sp.AAC.1
MRRIRANGSHSGEPDDEQIEQLVELEVNAEFRESDHWGPTTARHGDQSGEPLGGILHQTCRDDKLQAMKDCGVNAEAATSTATDGNAYRTCAHSLHGREGQAYIRGDRDQRARTKRGQPPGCAAAHDRQTD